MESALTIIMLISRFPPVVGGAEIQCFRLSRWLAAKGHRVIVLTERFPKNLPAMQTIDGVEVHRFPTIGQPPISSFVYCIQALRFLLRQTNYHLLHAHMISSPAILALLVKKIKGTPVLVKIAGGRITGDLGTSRSSLLGHCKLRLFQKNKPAVVCPSPETAQEAITLGIPQTHVSHIPNGVDLNRFKPASPSEQRNARADSALPHEGLIALYVGRWAVGKGVDHVLRVWEAGHVLSDFKWTLLLVLPERPPFELQKRISSLGSRVHMKISVSSVEPLYSASDAAMLLSEGEGLSNFLLEAMGSGLPVICSQAAAPTDTTLEDGILIAPKTDTFTQGALNHLNTLAKNLQRMKQLGLNARRTAERRFSLDRIGEEYLQLYRSLIGQRN